MGLEYFTCDVGASSAWWENTAIDRPNPKGGWVATYSKNFTKIAPAHLLKWYVKGYAEKVRQVAGNDPIVPDNTSTLQFKDKPKSHGKAWAERNKTGMILVTPWSAYGLDITRDVRPQLAVSANPQRKLQFQDRFAYNHMWYSEFAGRPYYWFNGQWSWHRVTGYEMITEAELTDESVLGSFSLAPEAHEAAITAALAEANQGYYDLLTELAELPETLSYLYGLLSQAKEATVASYRKEVRFKQMFKRKLLTAAQLATALADVWLQYRYAISPIIYSLQDIEKTLGVYSRLFKTARGREDLADSVLPTAIGKYERTSYSGSVTDRIFIKRAYSAEGLIDGILRNISLNPFATAWELVPLSFVVDWFINIGDVISAYTGPQVHVQQVSSLSRKCDTTCTFTDKETDLSVHVTLKSYVRTNFNPLDHVGLSFDPFINWKRSLDALALSWTFTKDDWMRSIKHMR